MLVILPLKGLMYVAMFMHTCAENITFLGKDDKTIRIKEWGWEEG